MNIIKKRIKKMAAEKPYYLPTRDTGDDFKYTRDDAIIEYDVVFDVNAELESGGLADFSLPEMKEAAESMQNVLTRKINEMNNVSFQKEITDTVTSVIVQNISDNVWKNLSKNGKKYNKNVFNRTTAHISVEDSNAIFNNELKVHFKMELNTGTVNEEFTQALKDAYDNTKNHCCTQIAKRMSDLYQDEKANGKGLELVKSVSIKFKSYEPSEIKIKETPVNVEDDRTEEEKKYDAVKRQIDLYIAYNGYRPRDKFIETICLNEGVDPSLFIRNYQR